MFSKNYTLWFQNVLVVFLMSLVFVIPTSAVTYTHKELYVSPGGSDLNPGSINKPFKSIIKAHDVIRENKSAKAESVTVFLREGTYYLDEPVVFSSEDSGTAKSPITYAAYKDEKAIISGGSKLHLTWKPYRDGIFQAKTPGSLDIDQLFVNGTRQHMARYPNYDPRVLVYHGYSPDAFSKERASGWASPTGGFIHAMASNRWGGYHYRITGKKADNTITYEGGWQNNTPRDMHKEYRFVENIFEELDAPGEWFHNAKTQTLYYYPPNGVNVKTATIEVARLRHLMEFQGNEDNPVKHITLAGLIFRHTARTFMETKEPVLRSDWTIFRGGAVMINGAEDCLITDCEFDQVGGNAVFVNNYNRRITVRGTHIHGAGASGVCFMGDPMSVRNPLFQYHQRMAYADIDKTPGPKTSNYPADCIVEDCLIHEIGTVEKQATGVHISASKNITIRHCSIYDVGRAGINISEGAFGGHVIEFCDVFDTVRETGDHGSFNSWGRDRFWRLEDAPEEELPELALLDAGKTIIRNSRWRCDHGWDIDLDDGSSNYHVYNNLCLNGGIKLREGFHRICENNIMVNNSFHPHVWYKNSQDVFRKNIVFTPYKPIRVPTPWGKQCDFNLLHNPDTSESSPAIQLQKLSTMDINSITANAMFIDPAIGDYRVAQNSPAIKLGFKNFPMDNFGVQKPKLKAIARTPLLPSVWKAQTESISKTSFFWQGATVKGLSGEEFSAFGVSKEQGGIHLVNVPAGSFAAGAGFKKGDLILSINGKAAKITTDLQKATDRAKGKSMKIKYVRSQKTGTTTLKRYVYVETEGTNTEFKNICLLPPDNVLEFKSVTSEPVTYNIAILSEGKLAKRLFGPVFRRGVVGGSYKIDLGKDVPVSEIRTFSFSKNGIQASQRFTLVGISEKKLNSQSIKDRKPVTIAMVDVIGGPTVRLAASRVQASDGNELGTFRWIEWVVQPVTDLKENTAFEEFQIR